MLEHSRMWKIVIFIALALIPACAEDMPEAPNENQQVDDYSQLNAGIQQVLTNEESVALASRNIEISSWHLYRAMNPGAVPQIVAILHDREMMSFWPAAIQSLSYVGGEEEALVVERFLLRNYQIPWTVHEREVFNGAFYAIGIMARRGNTEARRVVTELCKPAYWEMSAQPWYKAHPLGEHGIARAWGVRAKLLADGKVDKVLLEEMEQENHNFAAYTDSKFLAAFLKARIAAETKVVTQSERDELAALYKKHFAKK